MEYSIYRDMLPENAYSFRTFADLCGTSLDNICSNLTVTITPNGNELTVDDILLSDNATTNETVEIICLFKSILYLHDVTRFDLHPLIANSPLLLKQARHNGYVVASRNDKMFVLSASTDFILSNRKQTESFFKQLGITDPPPIVGCSEEHFINVLDVASVKQDAFIDLPIDSPLIQAIIKTKSQGSFQFSIHSDREPIKVFKHEKSFVTGEQYLGIIDDVEMLNGLSKAHSWILVRTQNHCFAISIVRVAGLFVITIHPAIEDGHTEPFNLPFPLETPIASYREPVDKKIKQSVPLILCVDKHECIHMIASEMAKVALEYLQNHRANILINSAYYIYSDDQLVAVDASECVIESLPHYNPQAMLLGPSITKKDFDLVTKCIEELVPIITVTNVSEQMLPKQLQQYSLSLARG